MAYSMSRPPIDPTALENLPKRDVLAYRDWFHAIMPKRIAELTAAP